MPDRGLSLRFVNAHYAPDVAATGEFLTDLAEGLAHRGHDVHVVTGRLPYGASTASLPDEERRNGVRITRVRTSHAGRGRTLGRLTDYLTFFLAAAGPATGGPRPDLTVYLTTPPLVGLLGAGARRLAGRPYGLWVMDLHPEAEVAHGILAPDGAPTRALAALDRAVFQGSSLTVALGRCMAARIRDKLPGRAPPVVLPLWRDPDEVRPLDRAANPLARRWNVGDRFVVMYSGNAGLAHRFDEIRALLRHWRNDPDVLFLFVGGGPRRPELEAFFRDEGIGNARYLDYVERSEVPFSLPLADVHLVSLDPAWSGIAVPSKIFGIMASGRPVAMVGPRDSEVAGMVGEAEMGVVVDPAVEDDPSAALVRAVGRLRSDPALRAAMGTRGREALVRNFSRSAGLNRWDALLRGWGRHPAGRPFLPPGLAL